jgi:hypothetical protein
MITTKFVLRSFLLPLFSFVTIILLSSIAAATMETTSYALLLPKAKTSNNGNGTNTLPLPSVQINLHMVKITSPTKGQQIPVRSNLTVTGTSVVNSTSADCQVAVIVNGIKPYQKAVPTGHGRANNYSTWNYKLTPTYAVIKQGQNKITAKLSCGNNSSLTSHNSVNVTGVANSNPANIASLQHVSSPHSKLGVHASASGYQSKSTPTRTTFNVNSGAVHKTSTSSSSPTHHAHRPTSGIYSHRPLTIIRIPHIPFPHIHFPKIPSFY